MTTLKQVKTEPAPHYITLDEAARKQEDNTIKAALDILNARLKNDNFTITSPGDTKNFLALKMSHLEHEVFSVMLLSNRHQMIKYVELFRGTIDGASVYPREVLKLALKHNAAALIVAHNHPSGVAEPSQSDLNITKRLKDALAMVDIRLLDHFIVGHNSTLSLAERGDL